MSTTSKAIVCALALACARPVAAAPGEAPASVEAALAAGDLSTARTFAEEARRAEPSPANWRREAEVCTLLADYACAEAAWQGNLAATPAGGDRKDAEAALAEVEELSRGTVRDEPTSTHRAGLDKARADKEAALRPKPAPQVQPKPAPVKRERIVKKWYFWVSMIAIAAAAGAITGIAVQAARDEQSDDLDKRVPVPLPPPQGFGLRF
jgi:hypothetical protein